MSEQAEEPMAGKSPKRIMILEPTMDAAHRHVPVAIDLFAGCGGLGEGLASAGIRVAVALELHPQPALTYAFNHPTTDVLFGDIRRLSMELLQERVRVRAGDKCVDLVVGGPPCQGFSTAGKKDADDPRNLLFYQFVRVVDTFRPRMFLLENVPGFKKMYGGAAFSKASQLFSELGYELTDTLVNAAEYGVPQRRLRFAMVGYLPGAVRAFAWPSPTHDDSSASGSLSLFPSSLAPYVTVEEALDDLAFLEPGWEAHRHQGHARSDFQRERRNGYEYLFNHLATRHRERAVAMFAHIAEGATIGSVPETLRSAKRTMARLRREDISNAVLAIPDDLIHYQHDRIPTVREMARLQTFDDDYVIFGKRTSGFVERRVDVPQYTQVGNAVPPLLARAWGHALLRALHAKPGDLRDVEFRRSRHRWVLGSSGYTGYTLSPKAVDVDNLMDTTGRRWPLPTSVVDTPVMEAESPVDWKAQPRTERRRQWAPGVTIPRGIRRQPGAQAPLHGAGSGRHDHSDRH